MTFKQIKINLEHFQLPGRKNTTRKTAPAANDAKEEREEKQRERQEDKTRKQLIRMIEQRQAANLKGLQKSAHLPSKEGGGGSGKKGPLADAFEYLGVVNQTVRTKDPPSPHHERTLKHVARHAPHEPEIHSELPPELIDCSTAIAPMPQEPAVHLRPAAPPVYGVLKGGTLPTYRQWMATQTPSQVFVPPPQWVTSRPAPAPVPAPATVPAPSPFSASPTMFSPRPVPVSPAKVYQRAKKKVRRTYKVGRPPNHPQVSVLLSNRTIRRHTMNELERHRDTPIQEVKTYLIRHGLIKRSTIAPNKVLRKMYEESKMVCGDIYNKNSDILLYNFLHGS